MENKDVLVIRYKVELVIADLSTQVSWHWAICRPSKRYLSQVECTREKAMEVIKAHGLVRTHKDSNGSVFDTPDMLFQRKYKGKLRIE